MWTSRSRQNVVQVDLLRIVCIQPLEDLEAVARDGPQGSVLFASLGSVCVQGEQCIEETSLNCIFHRKSCAPLGSIIVESLNHFERAGLVDSPSCASFQTVCMEPLHDVKAAIRSRCVHRTCRATLSPISVQPLDDVEMSVFSGAVHHFRRARFASVLVEPPDHVKVIACCCLAHSSVSALIVCKVLMNPLHHVDIPSCCGVVHSADTFLHLRKRVDPLDHVKIPAPTGDGEARVAMQLERIAVAEKKLRHLDIPAIDRIQQRVRAQEGFGTFSKLLGVVLMQPLDDLELTVHCSAGYQPTAAYHQLSGLDVRKDPLEDLEIPMLNRSVRDSPSPERFRVVQRTTRAVSICPISRLRRRLSWDHRRAVLEAEPAHDRTIFVPHGRHQRINGDELFVVLVNIWLAPPASRGSNTTQQSNVAASTHSHKAPQLGRGAVEEPTDALDDVRERLDGTTATHDSGRRTEQSVFRGLDKLAERHYYEGSRSPDSKCHSLNSSRALLPPTGRYVQHPARRGVARGLWRVVVLVLLERATLERAHSRTTQSHLRATAHTAQAAPMTSSSATYQAPAPAPPAAAQQLPPLASAVLVVGQDAEGQSTVPSEIAALPHVAELVSEFLDYGIPQLWSISRACECNFMTLLPRLAAREALTVGAVDDYNAVDDYKKAFEAGKGLVFAVKYDSMVMVQWLHAYCPKAFTRKAMEVAASAGKLHMLQWIVANFENVAISPIFAELAAESGHVDAFEWLWTHPKGSSATLSERGVIQTMEYAATNGHLGVVKWLSEHEEKKICSGASPFSNVLAKTIHYGHLDVAKYLFNLDAFSQGITSEAYLRDLVVDNRDAATVQWLRGLSQQTQQQSRIITVGQ